MAVPTPSRPSPGSSPSFSRFRQALPALGTTRDGLFRSLVKAALCSPAGQAARNSEFDPAVLERVRAAFLRPSSPLDEYLVCSFARAGTEPGPAQSWVVHLLDTPLSAVLPTMTSRSRPRALVALWRRLPEEQQLDQAIRAALTSADPGGVLTALSETEVSPASFGPELQALKNHHDGRIRYLANLLLARLETERAPSATRLASTLAQPGSWPGSGPGRNRTLHMNPSSPAGSLSFNGSIGGRIARLRAARSGSRWWAALRSGVGWPQGRAEIRGEPSIQLSGTDPSASVWTRPPGLASLLGNHQHAGPQGRRSRSDWQSGNHLQPDPLIRLLPTGRGCEPRTPPPVDQDPLLRPEAELVSSHTVPRLLILLKKIPDFT